MAPDGARWSRIVQRAPEAHFQIAPNDSRCPQTSSWNCYPGRCFTSAGGRFSVLPGLLQIALDGFGCSPEEFQMAPDGIRWSHNPNKMATDGPRRPHRPKEFQMAPDGTRWPGIAPDGSRLRKMAPDGTRCFQNAWNVICSPQSYISVL